MFGATLRLLAEPRERGRAPYAKRRSGFVSRDYIRQRAGVPPATREVRSWTPSCDYAAASAGGVAGGAVLTSRRLIE